MPLEPFTALAVAGNVVQFLDFTGKILKTSREISRSASGSTKENEDLSSIATNLQELCDRLFVSPPDRSRLDTGTNRDTTAISTLARDCKAAGDELIVALKSLQAKDPSKKSKRENIRIALATVWKKEDIDAMVRRLESYKSLLLLKLTVQSDRYNRSLQSNESKQLGAAVKVEFDQLRKELRQTTCQIVEEFRAQLKENGLQYDARVDQWLLLQQARTPITAETIRPMPKLSEIADSSYDLADKLQVLESLLYPTMDVRASSIADTHPKTFNWIFESTFAEWLKSTDQLYWISGKPGSGKSTLMKYLVHNKKTFECLQIWTGPKRTLVTASFYFWVSGSPMQKSQEGLLRSLLYKVLSELPALIPQVVPRLWRSKISWTKDLLTDAFGRLHQCDTSSMAFCFFIDGLDEYDGHHPDLISMLKKFIASENIKICLSSRPWNVFEAAFGDGSLKHINVQDYTKDDLRLYIRDQLESRPDLQELQRTDDRCQKLIGEIVEKAQGVFLWVVLVVRSLIEGLENSDRIYDLERRLREFPSDLHSFFMHMFNSLAPIYRIQTARTLQVTLAAIEPLSVYAYWFMDWAEENGDLDNAKLPFTDETLLHSRKNVMVRRLNARTKCLLEVVETRDTDISFRYKVHFLHRTVRDFMESEEMQRIKHFRVPESFNVDLAICEAVSAEIMTLPFISLQEHKDLCSPLGVLVYHAVVGATKTGWHSIDLLDAVGSGLYKAIHKRNRMVAYVMKKLERSPAFARGDEIWYPFLELKSYNFGSMSEKDEGFEGENEVLRSLLLRHGSRFILKFLEEVIRDVWWLDDPPEGVRTLFRLLSLILGSMLVYSFFEPWWRSV